MKKNNDKDLIENNDINNFHQTEDTLDKNVSENMDIKSDLNNDTLTVVKAKGSLFKKLFDYVVQTSSGMAVGLFATLIIGTIVKQISSFGNGFEIGINIGNCLISLMGAGISLGVTLSLKKELSVLMIVSLTFVGSIASFVNLIGPTNPIPTFNLTKGSNNPLLIYLTILSTIFIVNKILKKKTALDILLVPFVIVIVSSILSFLFLYPCYYLIFGIQKLIEISMPLLPEFMSIVISVIVGIVLTMPISSVAVCVSIDIGQIPLAAGAALIGCTVQMIGFATQSFRSKNSVGKTLSVFFGTSMLYWPNILKKPTIWLPTILTSAILGPIGVCILKTTCTSSGAGMGSCGLVGQISLLQTMGYTNPMSYISIFVVQVLGTILLVYLFDFLFRDVFKLYKKEDLKLDF